MAIDFRGNQGGELEAQIGQVLENDIYKLLNEAESLLDENPKLGKKLFDKADRLYRWHGYDFRIECMINDVFFECIDRGLIPNI